MDLFKWIYTSLGTMQSSHPKIWRNLGVILWTFGGIKDLNVVSFISTLCVIESTTLANPPFSNIFIISLCRYLTEISINIFGNTSFIFDSGFKTVTTLLDTNDGFDIGMIKYPFNNSFSWWFFIVFYFESTIIDFRGEFTIRDISALIFCPLVTKLRTDLWPRLVSFINSFIVGSNNVGLETPLFMSS